LKVTLGADI